MPQTATVSRPLTDAKASAAAVVSICSSRKFATAPASLLARNLPITSQDQVAAEWLKRLGKAAPVAKAGDLYGGRGFRLAQSAAKVSHAPLFIISAGLGLIAAETPVPAYGITVAAGADDALALKVTAGLDMTAWFETLEASPFSSDWDAVFAAKGPVLIALTRPYARLVGAQLAALERDALSRLRLFGESLEGVLPSALHKSIMPYDRRLDSVRPGARADFPQRALADFAAYVAPLSSAAEANFHRRAVSARLEGVTAPVIPERRRLDDQAILQLITLKLDENASASKLLRRLRDEDDVACEQNRFGRIYRMALEAKDRS